MKLMFDWLTRVALILAGTSLLIIALVQAWQVYARYVLNDSPGWTEPVALLLMNTAMMCGAAIGVRRQQHFSFTLVLDAASPGMQRVLRLLSAALIAAIGAALAWGGATLLLEEWGTSMAGAAIPEGLRYAPLILGGALICLFALEQLGICRAARQWSPEMAIAVLFGVFALLLLVGVPVAFALAAAAFVTCGYLGLPFLVTVIEISSGANSSTLIAIPLFILTGEIMLRGGLSDRIIAFAGSLVGHMRGGLGQVNVLACLLFGGVSGSAIADVSAIGGTMIPQMKQRGFDADFAVNVAITSALVALLVPPSHNLILYSAAAGGGISIADLFAAGIIPALMLMTAVMTTTWLIARRRGYAIEAFPGFGPVLRRGVAALPGLLLIGIILGGIRAGVFTAVESAAIAVIYALAVALLVYRQLRWPAFLALITGAVRTTGAILFVIAAAAMFGWLLAYLQVPATAVAALKTLADNPSMVLLMMVLVLLLLGTFMDMAPLIIICTPIFLPVAKAYGIAPVHFGIVLILTAGIGLITPPVGSVLFVGAGIGQISVGQALRSIWPFYLAAIAVLLLVTFIPALSLWLPAVMR